MISIYLPWLPTVNHYYIHTKRGIFISPKGRVARHSGVAMIKEQLGPFSPITTAVHLSVVMFPPDKRLYDLDNRLKCLLDVITEAGVWEDDALVDQLYVYRGEILSRRESGFYCVIREAGPLLRNVPDSLRCV